MYCARTYYGWVLIVVGVAAACSADSSPDVDGVNGADASAEATMGGSVGAETGSAAACVVSPGANAQVLSDKCGVFVSATGVDTNAGTKESPFRSVEQAVRGVKASSGKAWVFVCQGTYAEAALVVDGDISIYGQLDCVGGAWAVGTTRAVIKGRDAGKPVFTFNKSRARLEGIEIIAPDAVDAGQSSIGVFANDGELTVVTAVIKAGLAKDGARGAGGGAPLAQASGGKNAVGAVGGVGTVCACADGATVGAFGGTINVSNGNGGTGEPDAGAPPPDDGAGGVGNLASCSGQSNPGFGHKGAAGSLGLHGANANSFGAFLPEWTPREGSSGSAGGRAQGGGGGGARSGGGGGSGGCGGCGGAPGHAGRGGGASLAVTALSTSVSLLTSELVVMKAGLGGAGGTGQPGQQGGDPGVDATGKGCYGGNGGNGGSGGNGGGGAGGIAVGIAYKGAEPTVDSLSTFSGPKTPAIGGAGGVGAVKDGIVADKLLIN